MLFHLSLRYPRSKACRKNSRTWQQPSTAFLSGLWAWHHLSFSAQILAWKRETRGAGLLQCLRILPTCFRARNSGLTPFRVRVTKCRMSIGIGSNRVNFKTDQCAREIRLFFLSKFKMKWHTVSITQRWHYIIFSWANTENNIIEQIFLVSFGKGNQSDIFFSPTDPLCDRLWKSLLEVAAYLFDLRI